MSLDQMTRVFGGKVRVRVMGLLIQDDKILMLNHRGMNEADELWLPPGGGVEYQEGMETALQREFREEIGLEVEVKDFVGVNELITNRFHAYEFMFLVRKISGEEQVGVDPELGEFQSIVDYQYLSASELRQKGSDKVHKLFDSLRDVSEIISKKGVFFS